MTLPLAQEALAANFATSDFEFGPSSPTDPGSPQECLIDGPGDLANDGRAFDGSEQLSIDRSCTVKNFTCDNPLSSTLNFASVTDGTLIIFDNVCYTGNFACANVEGGKAYIWAVNGSDFSSVKEGCQDLIIPVEKIDKNATDLAGTPISSVTVGVPFIYTLDIPVMYDPVTGTVLPGAGSPNEIQSITIWDDLSNSALGVDLRVIEVRARYGSTPMVEGTDFTRTYEGGGSDNNPGKIALEIINPAILAAGEQVHFEFEVVLRETANNFIGQTFINVAEWEFARKIGDTFYDPLPGENGVAELLSISAPDLVMTKSTSASAINFDDVPEFTLSVQNVGGSPAWGIVIEDELPVGMQDFNPVTDGATPIEVTMGGTALTAGADYSLAYNSGSGVLRIELSDDEGARGLAPNETLQITYTSQLDQPGSPTEPDDGETLTNVAAATSWFNDTNDNSNRVSFTGQLDDGTVGTDDEQDAATVTAALTGYYFEKTVRNITSGQSPATVAAPGDTLEYTLRLFNLSENLYNVNITDQLDGSRLDLSSVSIDDSTCPAGASCTDNGSGLISITGDLDVLPNTALSSIEVRFEVDVLTSLNTGDLVSNQANMSAQDADSGGTSFTADSDDPNVNGVYNQADPPATPPDATVVEVIDVGPLLKQNPSDTEVAIGEVFEYTITVPQVAVPTPLYDVEVRDSLPENLAFISASADVGGTNYSLVNSGTATELILRDAVTGLDIPANQQAVVTLQVRLKNDLMNQDDSPGFSNAASYTFSRTQGGGQNPVGGNTTAPMIIVEPLIDDTTSSKSVANVTSGKNASDPAQGGDILEYTVTLGNNGSSPAYDVNLVDVLPSGVVLDTSFTPTLTINGVDPGFNPTPSQSGRELTWGRGNADSSLDIPAGEQLILTYRVLVNTVVVSELVNFLTADWTSLDGAISDERSGADAPDTSGLNNYFIQLASAPVATDDTSDFAKAVITDSWDDTTYSSADDRTLRVGDTVSYQLVLTLREGVTESVQVVDDLPSGLELVSSNLTFAGNINFTATATPAAGDTGTLTWNLGDITNTPDTDGTNDNLVIDYVVEVVTDTLAHTETSNLPNSAQLNYAGATAPIPAEDAVDVLQPLLSALSKTGTITDGSNPVAVNGDGSQANPFEVDLASHQMQFQLEACNAPGGAPAYNVAISDTLATQFDEADLATAPTVAINGTPLAPSDFDYTPPVRGGEFRIVLHDDVPLPSGQCLTVDYNIGFYTDVTTTSAWSNGAALDNYWSLPGSTGQEYTDGIAAQVWMVNASSAQPPVKTVLSPAVEATIGEQVTYRITVPADNIVRNNLVITDTLPAALVYESAIVTVGGVAATATDNSSGQNVSLTLASVEAGQEVVVTLTTYVANTLDTNAGGTFNNSVSFNYDGGTLLTSVPSADLRIVEPQVSVAKSVVPDTAAQVGDVLTYTVTLAAQDGVNFSTAFDLLLVDTLSAGLEYVPGTAQVDGIASEPTINGSPQVLSWPARDIQKGDTVEVVYQVQVQDDVGPGQPLMNVATATWTSLSGDDSKERDGSGGLNDYVASDSTNVGAPDNTTLAKAWETDTFGTADQNLRVGDRVDFVLTVGLQKGSHSDLELVDSLPLGMVFERVVSASEFGVAVTADPTSVSGDGIANPQILTWSWPSLTNPVGSASDEVQIVYRARVQKDVLNQLPTTQQLLNRATLDYTIVGQPAPTKFAEATPNLVQPELSVAKSVDTSDGDAIILAGEAVTYTVEVTNSGAAPAYDLVVRDTLPQGMRQNGGPSTVSVSIGANSLPNVTPTYDTATGVALWDFNSGGADTYTIQPGDTLTLVYEVSANTDLAAGLSLVNSAEAYLYYSFDDEAVPADGVASDRQQYGPSAVATAELTAAGPGALSKVAGQSSVAIGEQFTYTITVPEVPVDVALQDVRITDNLAATGVDLSFVSASLAGTALTNTGTADNLVLVDSTNGIDIPAGGQVDVLVTVEVLNTATNQARTEPFINHAWYDYDNGVSRLGDDATTGADSDPVTIVHPELVVEKTGPASLKVGTPDNFVLNVANTGEASAWNVTLTDWLPNPTPGGMCDAQPVIQSAVIQKADSSTVTLNAADFAVSFVAGDPTCQFTMTLQTDDALAPGDNLSVTYQVDLDEDNIHGSTLINIAGATEWFSADASSSERFAYQRQLTDGTPGAVDHEDSHEFIVEAATLEVRKTVFNVTTGESGATASPGDRLRYTIEIENTSDVPLNGFSMIDELDRLNSTAMFEADSLAVVTLPSGASESITGNGGSQGSGLLEVNDLAIAPAGEAGDTLTVEFEATLVPVITSGTVVLNQAQLSVSGVVFESSDDPALGGAEDPTETLIDSGPLFEIEKTSEDLTGDAAMLLPGETLRYTLTVQNIGGENAVGAVLRDQVPANTTYVVNSTTLNAVAVADINGGSPLAAGLTINSPGADEGEVLADPAASGDAQAVVTFDVTVNDVNEGTLISNQGFLNGDGAGSGAFEEVPSDDPATEAENDPTIDIVGESSLLLARKAVAIQVDNLSAGIVDPGDILRYTIVVENRGGVDATEAVLTDLIPASTTYVPGSTTLNGIAVSDNGGGEARIATGLPISSEDLTPPLPGAIEGVISSARTATIVFDVTVDAGTPTGTIISNQGSVDSAELPLVLTDADGNPANGAQPTDVVVGDAQQLAIIKEVSVVNGAAEAGATLEYLVTVTNISAVPASNVVITDDLLVAGDGALTYVTDSARLNGQADGITVNGSVITADYASVFGELQPEDSATLRFQAKLGTDLAIGTTVLNTAMVEWNDPPSSEQASVSIDVGGTPGIANLAGYLWQDVNFNAEADTDEQLLQNWTVELYFNGNLVETAQSDENGYFQFDGLLTNMAGGASYELRYVAPGAGVNTASLGNADSDFTNGPQEITEIYVGSGANLQNLNLPLTPNGVVYDSVVRGPVAGATLTMLRASSGVELPDSCFDDPKQQGQVTQAGGFYKFDLNFSGAGCPAGSDYLIQVELPGDNYVAGESAIIPPQTNADTAGFDVAACLGSAGDAVPATTEHCEAQASPTAPAIDIDAQSPATNYYLRLRLDDNRVPGESQLFNNHIAVDPQLDGALSITKTASMLNVTRSQLVPYTITFSNTLGVPLTDLQLVDFFPAGFKYVAGSARVDGMAIEPEVEGLQLRWSGLRVDPQQTRTAKLLLVVGSGVGEGEYVNRAQLFNGLSGQVVSGEAFATVRVIPDPTFDCTDVIGKVYDDKNMNGYQDAGEGGVPGARVVTATGLNATTDAHGRFHITCAVVPNQDRGSNFVLKLDDRSLPSGYRLTSENPRIVRATRGKMIKVNFGSSLHRVVRLDMAEGVFEPGSTEMRPQWNSRTELLLEKLQEAPSVLRLSYLAENEDPDLVDRRLQVMKARIADEWARDYGDYELTIETEVFWRRGAPPSRGGWK
ncbi:isopeptide-forming domain-containing fimbrial protein [Microbulbifer aggregans]|uniref:isopeptide-forming domain-containing fimbrial protein n=1 Tax=Microbulbifer aggregans TaxID=1769779 RepID=UPI001D043A36|nr:isopeptide-forming domain-containing fimbrial protein [Microbulbifer aggregans]